MEGSPYCANQWQHKEDPHAGSSSCPIPFIPTAPHLVQYGAQTSLPISALPPILCSISQPATTILPSMVFTSTTAPLTVTMTATTRRTWWKVGDTETLVPAAHSPQRSTQPERALCTKGTKVGCCCCPGLLHLALLQSWASCMFPKEANGTVCLFPPQEIGTGTPSATCSQRPRMTLRCNASTRGAKASSAT